MLFCTKKKTIIYKDNRIMKKFFTAIVAMVLAVPSFAQFASGGFELDKNNLYYGARMGLSLGSLTGDSDASGMKGGLTLGGVIGLRVSTTTPVFLESGLYYTQRGGIDGDYKANLKYLEVPVLIKYGIEVGEGMAVLPFIGPYFSWGIGGKCENKFEGVKQKWSSFRDDNFNHADMGLELGCGFEYNMLYVEAGYKFGIANIADNDDISVHGNALVLNFGINF